MTKASTKGGEVIWRNCYHRMIFNQSFPRIIFFIKEWAHTLHWWEEVPEKTLLKAKFWDYLEKTFVSDFTFSNIRHQLLPAATEMHAHGAKVDFSCHIGSEILKYTSALYFAINKSKNLWNHKSCLYLFPFNNITECTLQIPNKCFLLFFILGSLSKWFSAVRVACNTWISKSMP